MYKEVLTKAQVALLPFITEFKRSFYLVGGTGIALQIGHRRSIDFDLFISSDSIDANAIKKKYRDVKAKQKRIIYEAFDQLHFLIEDVKVTFFAYPYSINYTIEESFARIPDLLTLGAMKVLALGGRGKWKDYVDLYFLLKSYYTLHQISSKAEEIFGDSFNPKLFRQQLVYFEDIDYSEEVEYMGPEISKEEIKKFLIETATEEI